MGSLQQIYTVMHGILSVNILTDFVSVNAQISDDRKHIIDIITYLISIYVCLSYLRCDT